MFEEDIDESINDIILKYKLNVGYPEFFDYRRIRQIIKVLLDDLSKINTIAIRGGGKHTYELLKFIKKHWGEEKTKGKILFIVDQNSEIGEICGIKVLSIEEAKKCHVDVYLVSSFYYGLEMEVDLWKWINETTRIINLYDYFRMNGLALHTDFYKTDLDINYVDIFCSRKQYEIERTIGIKKEYLKKIIFQCIEIRDFKLAEKYVEEYIEKGYDDEKKYEKAWREIKDLLAKIEMCIKQRNQRDIIINWIDAVPYSHLEKMSFINKKSKEGLLFLNAFTPIGWTELAMSSMMFGKLPIDDKTYLSKLPYTSENSILLKLLRNAGYTFKYISYPRLCDAYFLDENKCCSSKKYSNSISLRVDIGCSTKLQWNEIRERLFSEEPVCHIVHDLCETHEPYLSPLQNDMNLDNWDLNYRDRFEESCDYIDTQLAFYSKFQNDNGINIYMTDHGKSGRAYIDDRSRVLMLITGNISIKGYEDRIYSHVNFSKLLHYVINPSNEFYNDIFQDYILLQNIDAYNNATIEKLKDLIISNKSDIEKIGIQKFFQYRAIRTKRELYVHYAKGNELYFLLPNVEENLIDNPQYQERINELMALCGDEFIDRENEHIFGNCKILYDLVNDIKEITW